jgi:hypothetical protein
MMVNNVHMPGGSVAASQVVLYFDRQEDALLFTLAASSAISAEEPRDANEAGAKMAREICKVSRITTKGALNSASSEDSPVKQKCA